MKAYRLCTPWQKPWDASGAKRRGGRWNSPGLAVIYAASSISLACLEILVHIRDTTIIPDYVYCEVDIPDALVNPWTENARRTEAILASSVLSREFGDKWLKQPIKVRSTDPTLREEFDVLPVHQVPSAVVPPEWNS